MRNMPWVFDPWFLTEGYSFKTNVAKRDANKLKREYERKGIDAVVGERAFWFVDGREDSKLWAIFTRKKQ